MKFKTSHQPRTRPPTEAVYPGSRSHVEVARAVMPSPFNSAAAGLAEIATVDELFFGHIAAEYVYALRRGRGTPPVFVRRHRHRQGEPARRGRTTHYHRTHLLNY